MYILNPIKLLFFLFLLSLVSASCIVAQELEIDAPNQKALQGGWYTLDPYLYEKEENGIKSLHGLDFELMKVISKEVGEKITYEHVFWNDLLQDIQEGKKDFATGALFTEERASYAYYSLPYRYEENSLFVPRAKLKDFNFKSIQELLNYMKEHKLKLGVVNGFIYADPDINEYIQNPNNTQLIIKSHNEYESVDLLLNNEIDGFLADRIVGATIIWRLGVGKNIAEHRLDIKRSIHIMFSKKTVSPTIVNQFNEAIQKMNNTEQYEKIVSWYLYPILFLQTEDTGWFRFTEIIGTIAFAISGLMIAYKEKTTLFGALILAILPSLGGGLMRDVIFGRNPVGALQSPIYLSCVLLTVLIGFMTIKLLDHFRRRYSVPGEIEHLIQKDAGVILVITDAIGLAMFSVIGVIVSLSQKTDPLWIWGPFFAFITGAGGGILRDMLSKSRYIAALEGELYGEIAIIWGFFLSVFILISAKNVQPEYIKYAVIITILGIFFTRLIVHFMHVPNARFRNETNNAKLNR